MIESILRTISTVLFSVGVFAFAFGIYDGWNEKILIGVAAMAALSCAATFLGDVQARDRRHAERFGEADEQPIEQ